MYNNRNCGDGLEAVISSSNRKPYVRYILKCGIQAEHGFNPVGCSATFDGFSQNCFLPKYICRYYQRDQGTKGGKNMFFQAVGLLCE